jgi:hypothetical protein
MSAVVSSAFARSEQSLFLEFVAMPQDLNSQFAKAERADWRGLWKRSRSGRGSRACSNKWGEDLGR